MPPRQPLPALLVPWIGILCFATKWVVLMFVFVALMPGIVVHALPLEAARRWGSRWCVGVAVKWVATNRWIYRALHRLPAWPDYGEVRWEGAPIDPQRSYLILANHQSWADILILFHVFHRRTPFLRFFLKKELIYVPVVGLACWAMDFPFMKRHSREAIAKRPELADEDLRTTRLACQRYREQPVTVVNFPEGTRFTPQKRDEKHSEYQHLLRPKAAGLSFTLSAMGEQFAGILDVTLQYRPTKRVLLWSWLCGEQGDVAITVRNEPIPAWVLAGDYANDAHFRQQFQEWLNQRWQAKDAELAAIRSSLT